MWEEDFYIHVNSVPKTAIPGQQHTHHCYIDIGQGEMIHHKVRRYFHRHGSHNDGVVPESGIVEDVC